MARWIINRPEEHSSEGEILVARQLANLSDRWIIRWGFYYEDDHGQSREGDFLILGPHGGLMVMEVKGGNVRHFSSTGNWENDVAGQTDHPLHQLDAEWKAIIRTFQEEVSKEAIPFIKQVLCVPNAEAKPDAKSWQGIPRKHVITGNDLNNFSASWRRCFKDPDREVRPRERDAFLELFGEGSKPEKLREFIDHTEHRFREQLTRSYGLLDTMSANRQILVCGGTGTGKTWLAIEQAARYAENPDAESGRSVLFLCYNLALVNHVSELIGKRPLSRGSIEVMGWEALGDKILAACGIDNEAPAEDAPGEEVANYYGKELPGILEECVSDPELNSRLPVFDALVVDEAQDHNTEWWHTYFALLKDGTSSPISLFYDPAQRAAFRDTSRFDIQSIASQLSQPAHANLPKPLRYTRQVYEYLRSLVGPGTEELHASLSDPEVLPEGPEVTVVQADKDETAKTVEGILSQWKESGLCEPHEVILLHVKRGLAQTVLGDIDSLLNLPLVNASEPDPEAPKRAIQHTTIHRAKGLDETAVILVGLRPFETCDEGFQHTHFMGASRAKQLLAVVEVKN